MSIFDSVSLLYTHALITMVISVVLWMSRVGLRDGARGVRTWVVADIILAIARCLAVLDASRDYALLPFGPLVFCCTLSATGIMLHLEAVRRLAGQPTRPAVLAVQTLALMLATGVPLHLIEGLGARSLWFNAVLAFMAALMWRNLWPWWRLWGARIMCAVMMLGVGVFAVRLVLELFGAGPQQMAQSFASYRVWGAAMIDLGIGLCLSAGFLLLLQERLRERIERLVVTDALTGTLNRHGLMPLLENEMARAGRHDRALSVALFDLDHFKRVNDEHGHAMGDRVLAGFAARVHGMLRSGDLFGRWGGEEFILVLPETRNEAAQQVAERIRAGIEAAPLAEGAPAVTVSGGVASAIEIRERAHDLLQLLDLADRRLYRAKETRNRIVNL